VIITSLEYPELQGKHLEMFASRLVGGGRVSQYRILLPKQPAAYTGTGDLVAALLLAWTHRHPTQLLLALEKCGATMQAVINRTAVKHNYGPGELQLIQSKKDIEDPQVVIRAERLDPPVQGVVFDMDGTLTMPGQLNIQRIRELTGVPAGEDIVSYVQKYPPEERDRAMGLIEAEETAAMEAPQLQPGLKETILALAAKKIPLAIATRNTAKAVTRFLEVAGLPSDIFSPVVTRDDEFKKPDPRVIQSICGGWALPTENVIMVGDSMDDISCGRDAGSATCLVVNERNKCHESNHHMVDHAITHLEDLLRIVEQSNLVSPKNSPTLRPLAMHGGSVI